MWIVPYKARKILRKLTAALFHEENISPGKKHRVFYEIMKPALEWILDAFEDLGLEEDEASSELYLFTCVVFDNFDASKSSIVPYLENNMLWLFSEYKRKFKMQVEEPIGLTTTEGSYTIESEFYLTSPEFMLETKWLGKNLSSGQKNLILKILTADNLSVKSLADECRLSRTNVETQLQNIATVIKKGYLK